MMKVIRFASVLCPPVFFGDSTVITRTMTPVQVCVGSGNQDHGWKAIHESEQVIASVV